MRQRLRRKSVLGAIAFDVLLDRCQQAIEGTGPSSELRVCGELIEITTAPAALKHIRKCLHDIPHECIGKADGTIVITPIHPRSDS